MKISAALMVKNEEKNIARCLRSITKYVDEIIIVDTGSTDRTVNICKGFNVKIYHHPWENDFSKHRNQSFSYASHPWIFQIDADEQLVMHEKYQNNFDILRNFCKFVGKEHNAIGLRMRDMRGNKIHAQHDIIRVFRNGKVKYQGIVHNEPVYDGIPVYFHCGYLNHFGYDLTPEQKNKKAERTITLLEKRISDNPKDWDAHFYMAEAVATYTDDLDKAIHHAWFYMNSRKKILSSGKGFFDQIYTLIINMYRRAGDTDKTLECIKEALKYIPDDLDLAMCIVQHGILTNDPAVVSTGATKFIRAYDEFEDKVTERAGRFAFHYTKESLIFCLYQLVLSHFECAKHIRSRLDKELKDLSPEVNDEFAEKYDGAIREMELCRCAA